MEQLSVFLENKSGRLTEVAKLLGNAGINLLAMTIADNSDFGTLRCIVSDTNLAEQVLKKAHFAVKRTHVVAFKCANVPGSLASVLAQMHESGLFIEYMYSFARGEKSVILLLPSDLEACTALLETIPDISIVSTDNF